jgi:dienelactone hydrolase
MRLSIYLKHQFVALAGAFFLYAPSSAAPVDVEFSLPTTDHRATIRGVITLPHIRSSKKLVPVIIVNGTTGTRDGTLYAPYDLPAPVREAHFVTRTVALALARQGFAVIRYDSRGITSQPNCERLRKSRRVTPQQYLGDPRCYDKAAALTITYDSKKEDLASVYAMIQRDQRFDAERIVIMPISEGGIHTARLIAEDAIHPAGIVFWSTPVQSPQKLLRWQSRDSYYEQLLTNFRQEEGILVLSDGSFSKPVDFHLPEKKDVGMGVIGYRNIPNIDMLKMMLDHHYQYEVKIILSQPPSNPRLYASGLFYDVPIASLASWQGSLLDDTSLTVRLKNYAGKISLIYGQRDTLVPVDIQLQQLEPLRNAHIHTIVFPDLSHSLTTPDNHFTSSVVSKIVQQVQWVSHK